MKRIPIIAMATASAINISACDSTADNMPEITPSEPNEMPSSEPESKPSGERTLVVYYSFTGNCQTIATYVSESLQCDILRIEPADEGIDYAANNYAAGSALISAISSNPNNAASYPAIKPVSVDWDNYSTVVIVTPLWWSHMAAHMQTFLFNNSSALAGKSIGLIVSSHSSGISGVEADARRLAPQGEFWNESLWINAARMPQYQSHTDAWLAANAPSPSETIAENKMYITIDGQTRTATLVDNTSTKALIEQLRKGDIVYEAHDYGNFEKVGDLGYNFPQNNEEITTSAGDLILYTGNNLCIYYSENTWDFTRIGKIDGATATDIRAFVKAGQGNVTVRLSLSNPTSVASITSEAESHDAYSISGQKIDVSHYRGLYVSGGKKRLK